MAESQTITLPAQPESAAQARRFIRDEAALDTVRHAEADLLVTELVANVIKHTPSAGEVTVSLQEDQARDLIVTVSHTAEADIGDVQKGAGFTLLDSFAKSWGHDFDGETLSFWFTIRKPGTTAVSTDIDDEELFQRMEEDPAAYSDELVRRHSDLAESIARRYRGKGVEEDDLLQVAHMALLKAIQRYDPTAGSIRPYAAATISGEMKKMLRDRGWSVRVPRSLQERSLEVSSAAEEMAQALGRAPELGELAARLDLTEAEVDEALKARDAYVTNSMDRRSDDTGRRLLDRIADKDLQLAAADDRVVIETAIEQLPERKQRILDLRFNEDMTQAQIADEIGISQMHVSRLLRAAIEELRELVEKQTSEL